MQKAIFLGTAGYHPSEKRHTACVFLPEYGFVLDAGTGFFRVSGKIQTEILNIFISHAHLDHTVGLTYLIDILFENPQVKKVSIYAAKHHLDAIKEHLYDEHLFPVAPEWDFVPVEDRFEVNGVKIKTMPLIHKGEATGYRFEFPDKKTLAYITDTEASESYAPLMENADLAIHENNFPDSQKEWAHETRHSYTSAVAALATKAKVKKLALFHFNPLDAAADPAQVDKAENKFNNTVLAEDLMEIEF